MLFWHFAEEDADAPTANACVKIALLCHYASRLFDQGFPTNQVLSSKQVSSTSKMKYKSWFRFSKK